MATIMSLTLSVIILDTGVDLGGLVRRGRKVLNSDRFIKKYILLLNR